MLTDDGRRVTVTGTLLDSAHLDHGYALTVHREQGATADRTHFLAEGGGRELAYVAMSRARGPSTVHTVADNLDQAIEDVTHDWSSDRSQHWVTRTGRPGLDPATRTRPDDPAARLVAELERLERLTPPDITGELTAARAELDRVRRDREDLTHGTGHWQHHPAGRAAHQLDETRRQREHAELWLDLPALGRRERHRWRRIAESAARAEALAERDWVDHAEPALAQLDRRITTARHRVAELETDALFRKRWIAEHPQLARRLEHIQRDLRLLDDPMRAELEERLEALLHPGPDSAAPAVERTDIARIRQHLDRLQHSREIEPPGLSL